MADWRNRIVGEAEVAPDSLLANPWNFRVHPKRQRDAMESALDNIGWIQRIIVNRVTGHVLDGHMRVASAIHHGVEFVPVVYVELSEDEERAALATFDPLGSVAVMDSDTFADLTDGLATGSEVLDAFLSELRPDSVSVADEAHDDASESSAEVMRFTADLRPEELELVERAIALSGATDRSEGLVAVCRAYLAGGNAKTAKRKRAKA